MTELAGLQMQTLPSKPARVPLCESRYRYEYFSGLAAGEETSLPLRSYTLVVLSGRVRMGDLEIGAEEGFRGSGPELRFTTLEPGTVLLVAGVAEAGAPERTKFLVEEAKRVIKPWGHELWLSGEGLAYSLKKIVLRRGNRTSLQFHEHKHETNLILSGEPELTYLAQAGRPLRALRAGDTATTLLSTPVSVDIAPHTLHRLRALSDLTMYEASTPELDDVIRVEDDTSRGHGRISAEH